MKVKHLIMKASLHKFEFTGIAFMLNSCPNLEHLTVEIVDGKHWVVSIDKFNFL